MSLRPLAITIAIAALSAIALAPDAVGMMVLPVAPQARPAAIDPAVGETAPCFGATARDPLTPCVNKRLALGVIPSPVHARMLPNSPCRVLLDEPLPMCEFGVQESQASETVAIVGDSHIGHLRAAVDVVARANNWRAISVVHTSCPLSTAVRDLPNPDRFVQCADWKDKVFDWFNRHPEVSTIFVAGLTGGTGVIPQAGRSGFSTAISGYLNAWRKLPQTVRQIIVIRDTPKFRPDILSCVARAMARHVEPAVACALSRVRALAPDPIVVAAHRSDPRRVHVIDLTNVFCDARLCYPVIGGALVARDVTHLTATFAATLGPLLRRQVAAITAGWDDAGVTQEDVG